MAIGARSQSARTYLEKCLDTFGDCELEPLVAHGLRALRDTLPNEVDLTNKVRNLETGIFIPGMKINGFVGKACEIYAFYTDAKKLQNVMLNCRMFRFQLLERTLILWCTKTLTSINTWNLLRAKNEETR